MIAYIRKLIALSACTAGLGMAAEDLVYRFPTDNRTLLEENRGNDFYMYILILVPCFHNSHI